MRRRSHSGRDARHRRAAAGEDQPLRTKWSCYAPGHQRPTWSLDWAGASGVLLYSPELRYQNYGGPYGNGPYGSIDCGMMYKGMWLGY